MFDGCFPWHLEPFMGLMPKPTSHVPPPSCARVLVELRVSKSIMNWPSRDGSRALLGVRTGIFPTP